MIAPEKPVENPADFFGQKSIVRRIFSRIGTERPQSIAVIGGRKTGKTSLLNYICHRQVKEQYLEDSKYIFYKVSSTDEISLDSEAFIMGINRALNSVHEGDENNYSILRKTVEEIHARGQRLVFLFDDFHLITGNSNFPLEFFSFLRSLANNYNLAYITTSFLELQKLCVVKDIEESPFFNIFTNLTLGPLSLDEGIHLLASIISGEEESLKKVTEWCGTSPYLLKVIGKKLKCLGEPDFKNLNFEKTLLPEISPYFEKILSILPEEAFKPLKSIARDKQPAPQEAYYLHPLLKQGFLNEEDEKITCFSPSFSTFLKKQLSPKMLSGKV